MAGRLEKLESAAHSHSQSWRLRGAVPACRDVVSKGWPRSDLARQPEVCYLYLQHRKRFTHATCNSMSLTRRAFACKPVPIGLRHCISRNQDILWLHVAMEVSILVDMVQPLAQWLQVPSSTGCIAMMQCVADFSGAPASFETSHS